METLTTGTSPLYDSANMDNRTRAQSNSAARPDVLIEQSIAVMEAAAQRACDDYATTSSQPTRSLQSLLHESLSHADASTTVRIPLLGESHVRQKSPSTSGGTGSSHMQNSGQGIIRSGMQQDIAPAQLARVG